MEGKLIRRLAPVANRLDPVESGAEDQDLCLPPISLSPEGVAFWKSTFFSAIQGITSGRSMFTKSDYDSFVDSAANIADVAVKKFYL